MGIFIYGFEIFNILYLPLHKQSVHRIWPLKRIPEPPRVDDISLKKFDFLVVIPDVHADLENFIKTLWLAFRRVSQSNMEEDIFRTFLTQYLATHDTGKRKMISSKLAASGKRNKTLVIMLGDYVDKGTHSRECVELALAIESIFGWKSVLLYGNHEFMNFHRSASHYVHPEDKLNGEAREKAFSVDGKLWKRMARKMVVAARTSDPNYLFVHGALDSGWFGKNSDIFSMFNPDMGINNMNTVTQYMSQEAPDLSYILEEDDSPLWSRALETMDEDVLCNQFIPKMFGIWNAQKIFVGHNPQDSRKVRIRCGGKVLLTDVGISKWMFRDAGNPLAIVQELPGTKIEAIYSDTVEILC